MCRQFGGCLGNGINEAYVEGRKFLPWKGREVYTKKATKYPNDDQQSVSDAGRR